MKKSLLLLIVFLLTSRSPLAQPVTELRGVWLTTVASNVLTSDAETARAMDYLASIGVNIVFVASWDNGYTIYPSDIMQQRFGKPIWPSVAGRDPLQRVLIEAHRNGIEVVPWLEYGFAASNGQVGHILTKYPQWASRDNKGAILSDNGFYWMSGINPEVQDFMISLCTEMIDKYDIDGIQGDDRLPALPIKGGYDSVTVAIYKSENNGAAPTTDFSNRNWMAWRAGKLNSFFMRLRDTIKTRDKNLLLSAAPSVYPWGYENYLQDSKTWMENGTIDNLIPQLYRYDFASYKAELSKAVSYVPAGKRNRLFAGVLARVGSYLIDKTFLTNTITENRKQGVNGETYFFYEGIANAGKANGDMLKGSHYQQQALLPHRNGMVWRPKATIVNEDEDSLVVMTGKWRKEESASLGYKPNVYLTNDSDYASITYSMDVPYDAWYGLYAFVQNGAVNTTKAPYTVFDGTDSSVVYLDQYNVKNKGWQKLKDVYLTRGRHKVVRLDNRDVVQGKYITADAVMLILDRKRSPDVIVTSVDENKAEEGNTMVKDYSLIQNYPNPFNPSTVISFSLPEMTHVSLRVYDILGREVAALVNEVRPTGIHQVTFDAQRLASGVYFYTLNAGKYSQTRKMMLVR